MITTNIKKYRKEKGLSQAKLATLCGLPQTTISEWELKITENHPVFKAIRIAEALGIKSFKQFKILFGAATPDTTEAPD